MAEAVNHTFSSSNTLIEDLKKKIKVVEKELATIASTVKDLSVSFPLIGQKEKEKKVVTVTTPIYARITERSCSGPSNACPDALPASTIIV